ncbi:MAG: trypsin-like peptidase domain-containing protein [Bacteroidales bacterium]
MKNMFFNNDFLFTRAAIIIIILAFAATNNFAGTRVKDFSCHQSWQNSFNGIQDNDNTDFTYAAEKTIYGVVHVKTLREREKREIRNPFEFFFGPRERDEDPEPEVAFGSGVIVSENGYIVTNAHVIKGADDIEVTLNDQQTFNAELLGSDPNTDIAVIKIDAKNLPYISFGSSKNLRIGEWVLAVGNPFGLTSSVTAGIISAKERTLGVLREGDMPVESFLQTDAAVNVGNSGGALVNLKGELVGIPTLIISPTRTHIGTAFAVPSSIVEKIKDDIIEYGEVRRGVLGISIMEVTSELASEKGIEQIAGIYVESVMDGSAADKAGIQSGDVIMRIDGETINSTGELQQEISSNQPGDRVEISIKRDGRTIELTANLMSMEEQRELVKQQEETLLGATLKMVPEELKEELNLPGGVQVTDLESGELQAVGMKEGFIIVSVNNQIVSEPSHIVRLLEDYSGNVYIEGVYPDGTGSVYAFSL